MNELLRVDSRAIVRMASGAAFYGVLSWVTNVLLLPSASLISVRPAIVVPVFFGLQWGPKVGFFAGFVGNLLGDTLTGMGFFPQWDLGNGLVGAVAGLAPWLAGGGGASGARRATDALVALAAGALVALFAWMRATEGAIDAPFAGPGFAPAEHAYWPLGVALVLVAVRLVARRSAAAEGVTWGVLAVLVGMGTAALIDVPYNGMSLEVALFGEFLPASVANAVNVCVLLPPMLRAYERALVRRGR